jgi:hypothetical protein
MSRIPTITEQELYNLKPARLDEDFLVRLTACTEGRHSDLSEHEVAFEMQLRTIHPKAIPSALHASLLDALDGSPFAVDDKIVLFNKPKSGSAAVSRPKTAFRFNLAAAAAVAMLGSIAALMMPDGTDTYIGAKLGDSPMPISAPAVPTPAHISPAGFGTKPSDTRDEGVIWRGKNQPHRVLRLTFMDQVTIQDPQGNPLIKKQPRVEYLIIPEKVD